MTDAEKLKKCIEALQSIPHCEDPMDMLHTAQDVLKEIGEDCHSGLTEDM